MLTAFPVERPAPASGRTLLGFVALTGLTAVAGSFATVARRVDRMAAALFLPYIGWLAFATVLNAEIVRRNPLPDRPTPRLRPDPRRTRT